MLMDAGWKEGSDWINEVELQGMPNNLKLVMQIMSCMIIHIDHLL